MHNIKYIKICETPIWRDTSYHDDTSYEYHLNYASTYNYGPTTMHLFWKHWKYFLRLTQWEWLTLFNAWCGIISACRISSKIKNRLPKSIYSAKTKKNNNMNKSCSESFQNLTGKESCWLSFQSSCLPTDHNFTRNKLSNKSQGNFGSSQEKSVFQSFFQWLSLEFNYLITYMSLLL